MRVVSSVEDCKRQSPALRNTCLPRRSAKSLTRSVLCEVCFRMKTAAPSFTFRCTELPSRLKDASGGRQIHLTTVRSLSRLQDRRSERKCPAISGRDADVKRSQAIQRLTPHNVRRVFVLLTDQESTFVFAVVLSIAAHALQVLDRYSDELSEFLTSEIRQNVRGYH